DGIRAFHVTGVQTCALPISVDGPDGPVDVTQLPPPTAAAAVDVPVAGFEDAPPPDVAALPFAPPPAEAFVVPDAAGDPEAEGIRSEERRVGQERRPRGAP